MITGIIFGVGAAAFQSGSYILSRFFISRYGSVLRLLIISHILLGVSGAAMLPFVWPDNIPEFTAYFPPLLLSVIFYIAGQAALLTALKTTDASRIAPLLGLKVVCLALIGSFLFSYSLSALQWTAVLFCVLSAFLLNQTGGKIPAAALLWTLCACLGYSLSDLYIKELLNCFNDLDIFHSSLLTQSLVNLLCGIAASAAYFFLKKKSGKEFTGALPFTFAWLICIFFFFSALVLIGPVFANIIQSTRGIISIFLGWLVASAGYNHIESRVPQSVMLRRIGAAILMTAAIALFYYGNILGKIAEAD